MAHKTDIVLATANARYSHCAFGLKRLWSALSALQESAQNMEFTIQQDARDIADALLEPCPRIIGLGVYIWNAELLAQVAALLRADAPETVLVLGGPEMVDCDEDAPLAAAADYIVVGEGEIAFAALAQQLLSGNRPAGKMIAATPPDLEALPDPYVFYSAEDIRQRVLYVESSRGCPYRCAFCLSSRDSRVRYYPMEPFLGGMNALLARGARHFKFTDRTFNTNDARALAILDFFLQQPYQDIQLHFEIMPDRMSPALLEKMAAFPSGGLHLELGVQSVSPETQRRIHRNQNIVKTMETIEFLRTKTGAALHADLIVGLPSDTREDVRRGFTMLVNAGIHELQVGMLKRLRGTAIAGDLGQGIRFSETPPYEVLETPEFSAEDIAWFKRFARYCDLYYNKGNFPTSLPLLWETAETPYDAFAGLVDYMWEQEQKTHQIPLVRLAEHLYRYLVKQQHHDPEHIAETIESDFRRIKGRRDILELTIDN